jgi:lysophospholipase L1-like esterase
MRRFALWLGAFGLLVLVSVWIIASAGGRDGDAVVLLGDSITDWNRGPLTDALGETYQLTIEAQAGAPTDELMPAATTLAATRPDQVVINLGTNDIASGRSAAATAEDLDLMVRRFPPPTGDGEGTQCVHLVTVNTHMRTLRDEADVRRAEDLNRRIRRIAETRPNVDVIEWDRIIDEDWDEHPPAGTLTEDTIHPTTPEGRAKLVSLYADALDGCGGWWQL